MIHLDMVGIELKPGDFVVGAYGNVSGIAIYIVKGLSEKTVSLRKYDVKKPRHGQHRYAEDLLKLDAEQTKNLLFQVVKNLENK